MNGDACHQSAEAFLVRLAKPKSRSADDRPVRVPVASLDKLEGGTSPQTTIAASRGPQACGITPLADCSRSNCGSAGLPPRLPAFWVGGFVNTAPFSCVDAFENGAINWTETGQLLTETFGEISRC